MTIQSFQEPRRVPVRARVPLLYWIRTRVLPTPWFLPEPPALRLLPRFLRQAQGYIATEVKCESESDGRYRVRDFWSWHRQFERFRERCSEDFVRFEREIVDELVEKKEFIGAYYEADDKGLS